MRESPGLLKLGPTPPDSTQSVPTSDSEPKSVNVNSLSLVNYRRLLNPQALTLSLRMVLLENDTVGPIYIYALLEEKNTYKTITTA